MGQECTEIFPINLLVAHYIRSQKVHKFLNFQRPSISMFVCFEGITNRHRVFNVRKRLEGIDGAALCNDHLNSNKSA